MELLVRGQGKAKFNPTKNANKSVEESLDLNNAKIISLLNKLGRSVGINSNCPAISLKKIY